MKFIFYSEFGETVDIAVDFKNKGNEVLMHIENKEYRKIGDGMVEKEYEWWRCLGEHYIWVFDSCSFGDLQDFLRSSGENVFGGSKIGDDLENDRQKNQKWFARSGFLKKASRNFKDFDSAIQFVQAHSDKRWIMKQNGDAPKSLNHMSKFKGNIDLLFHLQEMKKKWNEAEFGAVDFDLMEVVDGGYEVAASAFWNGSEFLKDESNKVCGWLNFEEKKEIDGGLGETTGEMGTLFYGCNEDNGLFRSILMRKEIVEELKGSNFRGVFDINCIWTKEGIVALEPTMRPGIPSSSFEFIEGLKNGPKVFEAVACGERVAVEMNYGWGMVMCIVAKPYPVEADVEDSATSIGEKLWILRDNKPVGDFNAEQKAHIHLYNFHKDETGYRVATKNGYLLTVTRKSNSIEKVREGLIDYIKNNIYISGFKFRSDIGKRMEEFAKEIETKGQQESKDLFVKKQDMFV